ARPDDGEVSPELLDPAAADLRLDRPDRRQSRPAGVRLAVVPAAVRPSGPDRSPPAAAGRGAGVHRRAVPDDWPARGVAGTHLPRVAEQEYLRDPRSAR